MKTTIIKIKSIVWLFSILFLLGGCSVYKSAPATSEEAVAKGHPVKIHTINNESIIYDRIDYKDGMYYGVNSTEGKEVLVTLNKNEINSLQIKNKATSTAGNLAIVYPILGLVLLAAGVITLL